MHPEHARRIFAAVFVAAVLAAVPSHAAGRRRAVTPPSASGEVSSPEISGTVLDAVTGQPVASIRVHIGNKSDNTDDAGKFKIKNVVSYQNKFAIETDRSGYQPHRIELATINGPLEIRVSPTPTVTMRKTNGTTTEIDFESAEFGYPIAFSGYIANHSEEFCKPNGTDVVIDRSEIKRLVGPATFASQASCCPGHPLLKITAELKSGETTELYFNDTCSGIPGIDFIGRNHLTGKMVYTPFKDITEIVFP